MNDLQRAMTDECFYRHGDGCLRRRTHSGRVDWCWRANESSPESCDFAPAQADKIRVLQAEVRRLNELLPM